jgi:hypothetical protein
MDENTKHLIDSASIATVVGTLAGILPAIAAIFTIIWTSIRIYESETVQKLINKNNEK